MNKNKLFKYSIFFFFICAPLESISLGESFSLAKLTAIIVLIMWSINGFPRPRTKMLNAFYVLLGYACLSAIWGIDQVNSFMHILTFLIPSILVSVAMRASVKAGSDILFYIKGYVIGCVIAAAAGLYFREAMLAKAIIDSQERLTAFGADQNALAFLLTMGVACLLGYYTKSDKKLARIVAITLIGGFSFLILSTGSRTGLLLLLIVLGGYLLSQKHMRVFILFVLIIVMSIPLMFSFLPESIVGRFLETEQLVSSGNFSDRGDIWSKGIAAFLQENFILGVGYSNFATMFKEHFNSNMASHNTYLTYLVEFGVLGSSVFVYILMIIWHYTRKIYRLTSNRFVFFYVLPFFAVMFTLETEYKRWMFILGVLLESWYFMLKKNCIVKNENTSNYTNIRNRWR